MVFHKKPFPGQVYILEMAALCRAVARCCVSIYDGIATGTHHNCQRLNNLITRFDPSRDPGPEPRAGVSFILRRKLAAERRREVQRSGVVCVICQPGAGGWGWCQLGPVTIVMPGPEITINPSVSLGLIITRHDHKTKWNRKDEETISTWSSSVQIKTYCKSKDNIESPKVSF